MQSLHNEDLIVTHVLPDDKISDVKKTFEGGVGQSRSLLLDGKVLDDNMTVGDCGIPADCMIEWGPSDGAIQDNPHSPDSGFIASNLSGGITVSRDGSVTSTRRSSCPTDADAPSHPNPAPVSNACTHWLESGTCPFADRCHFAFTHSEANAGRDNAVCLAGKPVCKHWVADGACPSKCCYWKATHTPQNSPRYAKYLKATPMGAPVFEPAPEHNSFAHIKQPEHAGAPINKVGVQNGPPVPRGSSRYGSQKPAEPGQITVMKRVQPAGGVAQPPSPTITVMKRQPNQHQPQQHMLPQQQMHQHQYQQQQQQRVVVPRGQTVNYSAQPQPNKHNQSGKHAVRGARPHHDNRAQIRGGEMQEPRRTLYPSDRPRSAANHHGGGGVRNSGQGVNHRPVTATNAQGRQNTVSIPRKNMPHQQRENRGGGGVRSQAEGSNSRNRRGKGGGRRKEEDNAQ